MATTTYNSVTRTDRAVIQAFQNLDGELQLAGSSVLTAHLAKEHQARPKSALNKLSESPDLQTIAALDSAATWHFSLQLPDPWRGAILEIVREKGHDEIKVHFANDLPIAQTTKLITTASKYLPGFEVTESIDKTLGTELAEFHRRREAGVIKLEETTQNLIKQNEEYRRTTDATNEEFRQKLVKEQQELIDKTREENERKDAALKAREDALETKLRQIDDRDSRHVRREIRQDLKETLASREKQFKLSQSTNTKRKPIHLLFILLILISATVAYYGVQGIETQGKQWYDYTRFVVGLIALAASIVFYIRWVDQWFRQHANEEFRLQRLGLDIDRASWVVEMALEWKQQKGEEIPAELISRLTNNLFIDRDGLETPKHPAEELATALFQSSANMKLNLPGGAGEIYIDRKGIKNLAGS